MHQRATVGTYLGGDSGLGILSALISSHFANDLQGHCPWTVPMNRTGNQGKIDGAAVVLVARTAAPKHISSRNCRWPAEILSQQTNGLTGAIRALREVIRG